MAKRKAKAVKLDHELTGREVHRLLTELPDTEQVEFIKALEQDYASLFGQYFNDTKELVQHEKILKMRLYVRYYEAVKELKKHRKPAVNAFRDAEIVKLTAQGKTAGQVVLALIKEYPKITDRIVTAVNSRERKNQQHRSKRAGTAANMPIEL